MLRYQAAVLLAAALALTGCGIDSEKGILMAAGAYGDLAVALTDDNLRPAAERFLAVLNTPKTFVIKPETIYQPDIFGPDRWELAKGYKNAILLVRIGDGGGAEKAARNLVSKEAWDRLAAGGGGVVKVNDPWSTYQFVIVVASRDRNMLSSLLQKNADKIRTLIDDSNRERILRRNRYDGLNNALMDAYWDRYGFFLEIPAAFAQNQLEPDGYAGLELMQKGPSRGLSVAWEHTGEPVAMLADRQALLEMRREMGARLHNEELLPSTFVWESTLIGGVECLKLEGSWNSTTFAGGGPFWCYFVPDPDGGRMFCLDLLVYAPDKDKMNFFRRLEAVASTFSTTRPQP